MNRSFGPTLILKTDVVTSARIRFDGENRRDRDHGCMVVIPVGANHRARNHGHSCPMNANEITARSALSSVRPRETAMQRPVGANHRARNHGHSCPLNVDETTTRPALSSVRPCCMRNILSISTRANRFICRISVASHTREPFHMPNIRRIPHGRTVAYARISVASHTGEPTI